MTPARFLIISSVVSAAAVAGIGLGCSSPASGVDHATASSGTSAKPAAASSGGSPASAGALAAQPPARDAKPDLANDPIAVPASLSEAPAAVTGDPPASDAVAPHLNVTSFGAKGDGTTDNTKAFQAALNQAAEDHNQTIVIPCGTYRVTGELDVPSGIMIIGSGSQGSTVGGGTNIVHASNGTLFLVHASKGTFRGTGGGFQNLLIAKENGFKGGIAIDVAGTDASHRPGEMVFHNVLIYGSGKAEWTRGISINGSMYDETGSRGIRSVFMSKVRVGDCSDSLHYINLTQVTHFTGIHLQVDTGNGSGKAGLWIDGTCDNVALLGDINGELHIPSGANVTGFDLYGRCSSVVIEATECLGTIAAYIPDHIECHSPGISVMSFRAPGFCGSLEKELEGPTGPGTSLPLREFYTQFDKSDAFNEKTGEFAPKVAGRYRLSATATISHAPDPDAEGNLVITTAKGREIIAWFSCREATGDHALTVNCTGVEMLAPGEVLSVQLRIAGKPGTVKVLGTRGETTFSGELLP
jgi:hypothetical protein